MSYIYIYICRLGSSTRCHTSVGLRIGNRILDEHKSAETQCLENRIHLDWYSTAALQGRGRSPDGRWAINHADGEGTGSRCLDRQGADNGGSREQYCTWLHVPTPPTSQRQAVADTRQPARTCHSKWTLLFLVIGLTGVWVKAKWTLRGEAKWCSKIKWSRNYNSQNFNSLAGTQEAKVGGVIMNSKLANSILSPTSASASGQNAGTRVRRVRPNQALEVRRVRETKLNYIKLNYLLYFNLII